MTMQHSAMPEGKAASALGLPRLANPYRNEIIRIMALTNRDADSRLYELANDWDSGHARGCELFGGNDEN